MTITSTDRLVGPLVANGVTVDFPFDFKVFIDDDVEVTLVIDGVENLQVITTDYTVALNADQETDPGGTVTFLVAPDNAEVFLGSRVEELQQTEFTNTGGFYPRVMNDALDRVTVLVQQITTRLLSTVRLPLGTTGALLTQTPDTVLGFDATGLFGQIPKADFKGDPGSNVMAIGLWSQLPFLSIPTGTDIIQTSGHSAVGIGAARYVSDALATSVLAASHPLFCVADGSTPVRYWRLLPDRGGIHVDAGGAVGDGVTDDIEAILSAKDYAMAIEAGVIDFSPRKKYKVSAQVMSGNRLIWNFNGSGLRATGQFRVFGSIYDPTSPLTTVTQDILGPTSTINVANAAALTVGSLYVFTFGMNPYDNNEPLWGTTARVLERDTGANTVRLDVVIPKTVPITSAYNFRDHDGTVIAVPAVPTVGTQARNRGIFACDDGEDITVNDLRFLGDTPSNASVEGVMWFQGGRNITINRPVANADALETGDAGTGLAGLLQHVRTFRINDPILYGNKNGRNQASLGRFFNFSNCIDGVVRGLTGSMLQSCVLFAESFCENILIDGAAIEYDSRTAASTPIFFVAQGAEVEVRSPNITARDVNLVLVDSGGTGNDFKVTGKLTWNGKQPISFGDPRNLRCVVEFTDPKHAVITGSISGNTLTVSDVSDGWVLPGAFVIGNGIVPGTRIGYYYQDSTTGVGDVGTYYVSISQTVASGTCYASCEYEIDFADTTDNMVKVPLLASMGADPIFFLGPIVDVHMAASSTAALANLTGVYIGSDFNNGADWTSTIAVGEMKRPAGSFSEGTTYGNGSMWSCRGKIMVTTNASAPGANSFLGFIVRTARLIRTIHYDFTGDPNGTGQNTKSWTDWRLLRLFGPENTDLGWTTATGTANRGAFAAYGGATMGAAYVQAEAQATNDAAKNASQRVKALEEALRSAKIIN